VQKQYPTVAEVRAAVERGKRLAAERFERETGLPMTAETGKAIARALGDLMRSAP
jgi:hypothetical protein